MDLKKQSATQLQNGQTIYIEFALFEINNISDLQMKKIFWALLIDTTKLFRYFNFASLSIFQHHSTYLDYRMEGTKNAMPELSGWKCRWS